MGENLFVNFAVLPPSAKAFFENFCAIRDGVLLYTTFA